MHERGPHPDWEHTAGVPEGIVDVWRVDLREVGRESLRLLSVEERKRAAAVDNPARRALWMRARGVLRMLLSGYLHRPAGDLEFVIGEHGKPELVASPKGSTGALATLTDNLAVDTSSGRGLHFNLSHSEALALYAFTAAAPLGIDLELERARTLDEAALAERTFGAQAAESLRQLDAPARRQEFLRLWVRHEAALKCLGYGLTGRKEGLEPDTSAMWIADLDLGPGTAAAIAVRGGPLELRLWDWPAGSQSASVS
jgi:4'-phosphopantetheinyl transferase